MVVEIRDDPLIQIIGLLADADNTGSLCTVTGVPAETGSAQPLAVSVKTNL